MKADLNTNIQPRFQAHISPKFVKFMRSYINNGRNRLHNTYRLDSKIKQIDTFGYDNYTIELINKSVSYGKEYILAAVPDGAPIKDAILIDKRENAWQIVNSLLSLRKGHFIYKMQKGKKINLDV